MPEETEESQFVYTGRYTRAFLNGLVGPGNFTIRTYPLDVLATREGNLTAQAALDDDTLSMAYMSDTKLTCLWLHEYPGWLAFCEPLGIEIRNSSKIAKRLTVITRLTYLHAFKGIDDISIGFINPSEFSEYDLGEEMNERFLDGANVISRELLEEMISNGSNFIDQQFKDAPIGVNWGNPWEKDLVNRAVDRAGTFSLRVTGPFGLIKGDAICVPRDQIPGGHDILSCKENVKGELRTNNFVFVLAEPHPGVRRHEFSKTEPAPPPVWSDDQSMSWLGEWLFPREQLVSCLKDFAEMTYSEIEEGRYPKFFTDTAKRDEEHSTITQFQGQALQWEAEGLGLDQSIFLQERIGQGAINQLSKKRRWPIPCAIYVHVASDSWLHMAGFFKEDGTHPWPFHSPTTPEGSAWFHEETGRLIYNDKDFADLYDRHGGWDLDDSVKVHYRTMGGRKKLVIVRSPNAMGEYDIKDYVPDTYYPTWTKSDGTVIEFPEIVNHRPAFIEEMNITYKHASLAPPKLKQHNYTRDVVREATDMSRRFMGVFGKRANADMAYYATFSDYRREQLAPIEAIVDACTQEQSEWALNLIEGDTEAIIQELRSSGRTVDRTLWKQRVKRFYPDMSYGHLEWSQMAVVHDNLCDLYQQKFFELAQRTVDNVDPDIFDLGLMFKSKGEKLVKWYYELVHTVERFPEETRTDFCHRINAHMCRVLGQMPEHLIYNNVLAMARYVYSNMHGNEYKDTAIFQNGAPLETSIFTFYIEALRFYGVGNESWSITETCSNCQQERWFTDRVMYQMFLVRANTCEEC